jgi:hypothetical protein
MTTMTLLGLAAVFGAAALTRARASRACLLPNCCARQNRNNSASRKR